MNQTNRMAAPSGNQKIVFVTQRPQTPASIHPSQPTVQNPQNTVVKIMTNANSSNPQQQKVVNPQQKLVVVCMPNATPSNPPTLNTQAQGVAALQNNSNQSNISLQSPIMSQNISQPHFSVVPKTTFIQQNQKPKQDNLQLPPGMDDLGHLS